MIEFNTNLVLITGALGWLGINLVESLVKGLADFEPLSQPQKDLKIRCLILPNQDPTILQKISNQIEVYQGDLRNPQDCDRFCENAENAILFHTAGIIHPQKISEFYQINVEATKNLLNYFHHYTHL